MTSYESQHAGQRAFAAMHAELERENDHKLFVMEHQQQDEQIRNLFDTIGIHYERVTVHLHPGEAVALRISNAAAIFLATLKLVTSN